EEPITVKTLSAALGVKSSDIQSRLAKQGIFAVVNQGLDRETAEMIALEYGAELIISQQSTLEETLVAEFEQQQPDAEKLIARPDANEQQVLGQLAGQNLNPVEWGGDIEVIRTSATTGKGIEELIEILDYQSQLLDLKTDPTAPARGTVIESRMEPGLGPVA